MVVKSKCGTYRVLGVPKSLHYSVSTMGNRALGIDHMNSTPLQEQYGVPH